VRGLLANLALSVASVAVVLGALEGVCRLFDHDPPARPVASYITVWNDGEFYTVKSAATGWPPWEDYNRDGMRDREHAVGKRAGVRRVVILGDSVTLGYGLRPEEAFPQVLQDLLDARGEEAEVFNVAFSGWSTRQERIAYERIGRKYRPDDVVVAVCLNDIPEIHNNLTRPPALLRALHQRSALVRRLVGARRREIHDVEELFKEPDSASVTDAFAQFFRELEALRGEVVADGGRFGVAVVPFRLQVDPSAPAAVPQARIAAFCAGERIAFADLLPGLRPLGGDAFLDYDHLTAVGARRVAELLAASALLPAVSGESPSPVVAGQRWEEGIDAPRAGSAPALLARLRDGDASARVAAARALGNAAPDPPSTVPALSASLRDPAPAVRAAAAWALGGFGPGASGAIADLVRALADPNPTVRAAAAHTLGAIGPEARASAPGLIALLSDSNDAVRWRAEDALARIGPDPAQAIPLLLPLLADPGAAGRGGAAAVVARMGVAGQRAVPELTAALADTRGEVRWKAAWALEEIGPAASAAVSALIGVVRDPDAGWHAIDALGAIGPAAAAAVPALRAALADPSSNIRWRAALALGHIGTPAAAAEPDLRKLLDDPADNVRLAAVHGLQRLDTGAEDDIGALAHALAGDTDSRVRAVAAAALGRLASRHDAARGALVAAVSDADPLVRASSVRALGRVSPTTATAAALDRALADPDPSVRAEAAKARRGQRGN
jgi:HEAT repeat protein/lysophospholipase L1-like esterase